MIECLIRFYPASPSGTDGCPTLWSNGSREVTGLFGEEWFSFLPFVVCKFCWGYICNPPGKLREGGRELGVLLRLENDGLVLSLLRKLLGCFAPSAIIGGHKKPPVRTEGKFAEAA